ncbi:hypothetical protein [Dyella sp. A6]|uniref:hypothetical protein n=1 Tax=Dyella aluminiiresistens TaxID=3069105 RepID=UPI002E769531|nr:hypothetical protein [Dyella sp. A6]
MITRDIISIIGESIQAGALFVAGMSIWWQLRKANEDRENGTYDSLDERFTQFLEVCSKYPNLEVYAPTHDNWNELDSTKYRRQLILYQILVSIFERSYILYNEKHALKSRNRRTQWDGWVQYMRDYAASPVFQYAWHVEKIGKDMDKSFLKFMEKDIKIKEYTPLITAKPAIAKPT